LELLESGGARQIDTNEIIQRYEKRIAMTMMTQFIFLGMDSAGSFSLSNDMTSMFALSLGAMLDSIEETYNRFVVREIMELNGVPEENIPRWSHGDPEKQSLAQLTDALSKLVGADIITKDEMLEAWAREHIGAPPKQEGFEPEEESEESVEEAPEVDEDE
jgi:phage gp29-like protein